MHRAYCCSHTRRATALFAVGYGHQAMGLLSKILFAQAPPTHTAIKKTSNETVLALQGIPDDLKVVQGIYALEAPASASCSKRHMTLPLPLLGKASTKDTRRGTL